MSDLQSSLAARLAGFGCCEGYENSGLNQTRSAVIAILACHPAIPYGIVNGRLTSVCNTCNQPWPCPEVRLIARVINVEVPGG